MGVPWKSTGHSWGDICAYSTMGDILHLSIGVCPQHYTVSLVEKTKEKLRKSSGILLLLWKSLLPISLSTFVVPIRDNVLSSTAA